MSPSSEPLGPVYEFCGSRAEITNEPLLQTAARYAATRHGLWPSELKDHAKLESGQFGAEISA